jgi:hypothetical protein
MVVGETFKGGAWLNSRKGQTYEGSLQHHNHAKMNARILGNAMVV